MGGRRRRAPRSVSSRSWQREVAESVIAGQGEITEEFVDVGWSRGGAGVRGRRRCSRTRGIRGGGPTRSSWGVRAGFTARQFLRVAEQLERAGEPAGRPVARCGWSIASNAVVIAVHPSGLLAFAGARRLLMTTRPHRAHRGLGFSECAGEAEPAARAGRATPWTAVTVASSTAERSRSTGPKACGARSVMASRPIGSHSIDSAVMSAAPSPLPAAGSEWRSGTSPRAAGSG
jgi:hypothetical protein